MRATVNLVHGMGEHCTRYGHVAEFLTKKGYAVYAFDQLGHGRTIGKKGHAPSYDALLDNIGVLLEKSKKISRQELGEIEQGRKVADAVAPLSFQELLKSTPFWLTGQGRLFPRLRC